MKDEKLRRALKRVSNVAEFCRVHDLPERTVFRARVKGVSLSKSTIKLLQLALTKEGLLSSGDATTNNGRVARRVTEKVGGRNRA